MKHAFALLALIAAATAQAQSQPQSAADLPKFPTAPGGDGREQHHRVALRRCAEYKVDPSVLQGEIREFIMYSEDSKIYPGIVRIENEISAKRDAYGNGMPAPKRRSQARPL
ncbi:MAG: hypothetical protein U1E93_04705 [Alphaproteobacteria bacterium]